VEQEQVDNVALWSKAFIALVLGAIWGAAPIEGLSSGVGAVMGGALLSTLFLRHYLCIFEDDFGGALEVLKQGAGPAIFLFLVRTNVG
jgi:hypothetical protein